MISSPSLWNELAITSIPSPWSSSTRYLSDTKSNPDGNEGLIRSDASKPGDFPFLPPRRLQQGVPLTLLAARPSSWVTPQHRRDHGLPFEGDRQFWSSAKLWLKSHGLLQPHRRYTDRILLVNALAFLFLRNTHWQGRLAKINACISQGEYWRLVTPMFLHHDIIHLLVNCYSLHLLGPPLEAALGPTQYLILYLGSGVCGNLMSYLMTQSAPYHLAVGSSTSIYGLFGALAASMLSARGGISPENQMWITQVVGLNLVVTFLFNVDIWGHVGGLLGGAAIYTAIAALHKRGSRW